MAGLRPVAAMRTPGVRGPWLTRRMRKPAPVIVPKDIGDLPYADMLAPHEGGLADGGDYDTVHFDQVTFEEENASGARFLECALSRVTVTGGRYRRTRFSNSWLKDVRMTLPDLAESGWSETTVVGGVIAGVQAFGSVWDQAVLSGCKLDSVNFRDARLTRVRFQDCLLRDVDFSGATLKQTTFTGCTLTRVDFSRTKLDRVDLRGAELGLIVGPEPLRGAIVNSAQLTVIAPLLAEAVGLTVDDG